MNPEKFYRNLTTDIKIRLDELFDQNFENRSFFGQPWDQPKQQKKDSILNNTGTLRVLYVRLPKLLAEGRKR